MKSGLEGRNNTAASGQGVAEDLQVSMKSGLEGRNNAARSWNPDRGTWSQ